MQGELTWDQAGPAFWCSTDLGADGEPMFVIEGQTPLGFMLHRNGGSTNGHRFATLAAAQRFALEVWRCLG